MNTPTKYQKEAFNSWIKYIYIMFSTPFEDIENLCIAWVMTLVNNASYLNLLINVVIIVIKLMYNVFGAIAKKCKVERKKKKKITSNI